ncbi:B12-binding domain-containing radical SAM protein [Myxococcota bacterium]|nr:B12-binding domain-containing radical SAM protein [Myxococcota bacterium]
MRALVITGGLFEPAAETPWEALQKQWRASRASAGVWLDLRLKVMLADRYAAMRGRVSGAPEAVRRLLGDDPATGVPELTEVSLASLLEAEGVEVEVTTWSEVCADPAATEARLGRCPLVLASTTLLRDLSELSPLASLVKRPHNRVVVGGALVSMLIDAWPSVPGVDLAAAGDGERLVPALVAWARGGFVALKPPEGGRVSADGAVLRAGPMPSRSLDDWPSPDWRVAERLRGRAFPFIHYESVRGCPYRCAFCNYPFLFDDNRFRLRSAARVAEDWAIAAERGARWISCLDSLFTLPPRRLDELLERLIAAGRPVEWLCYARADDLTDPVRVRRLREAGCRQVQIGVESGSAEILRNMNKRTTPEINARALQVCRDEGLTTVITLIVGFPGETERSLAETRALVKRAPPDFFFVAPFSTKSPRVPILSAESRAEHDLITDRDPSSSFPAWRHRTMDTLQAIDQADALTRWIMAEGLGLNAGMFFQGMLRYDPATRAELLRFQRETLDVGPGHRLGFGALRALTRWGSEAQQARL